MDSLNGGRTSLNDVMRNVSLRRSTVLIMFTLTSVQSGVRVCDVALDADTFATSDRDWIGQAKVFISGLIGYRVARRTATPKWNCSTSRLGDARIFTDIGSTTMKMGASTVLPFGAGGPDDELQ
jgi:hypothetical protein